MTTAQPVALVTPEPERGPALALVTADVFVLARTATGRPSLQHLLDDGDFDRTSCGRDISTWSRSYTPSPIPQIMCKKCAPKATADTTAG